MRRILEAIKHVPAEIRTTLQHGAYGAVIAAVICLFLPNYYTAEAEILPKDLGSGGGMGGLMATAAAFGLNLGNESDDTASYVDVLGSRRIAEAAIRQHYDFGQRPLFFLPPRPCAATLYDYLDEKNIDRAVTAFDKQVLSVDRDLKSSLVTVRVTTKSPELSQAVLKLCIRNLEDFIQQQAHKVGEAKASYNANRLVEANHDADVAQQRLQDFALAHLNYSTSPDPRVRLEGARLEAEVGLRQQVVNTLTLSREQALLDSKNDTPVINVLDDGNLPVEKAKPKRAVIVMIAFLLSAGLSFAWRRRVRIVDFLLERRPV